MGMYYCSTVCTTYVYLCSSDLVLELRSGGELDVGAEGRLRLLQPTLQLNQHALKID